jgi:hypothetical protein
MRQPHRDSRDSDLALQSGIDRRCRKDKIRQSGNMGSKIKFNYSAVGDGVNLASRLESETKKLGVKILISQNSMIK